MKHVPKFTFVGIFVWVVFAILFRTVGANTEAIKMAVVWSFVFVTSSTLLSSFHYVMTVELSQVYAKTHRQQKVFRKDVMTVFSYVTVMFVGLPLSAPLFKTSEAFFGTFTSGCGLLFILITLWIGRMLFHGRKTGQLFMKGGYVDRNVNQNQYWFYFSFLVFTAIIFLAMGCLFLAPLVL